MSCKFEVALESAHDLSGKMIRHTKPNHEWCSSLVDLEDSRRCVKIIACPQLYHVIRVHILFWSKGLRNTIFGCVHKSCGCKDETLQLLAKNAFARLHAFPWGWQRGHPGPCKRVGFVECMRSLHEPRWLWIENSTLTHPHKMYHTTFWSSDLSLNSWLVSLSSESLIKSWRDFE